MTDPLVLVVNPGAGSTKLGLFRGAALVREEKVLHPGLMERPAARVWAQFPAAILVLRVRCPCIPHPCATLLGELPRLSRATCMF